MATIQKMATSAKEAKLAGIKHYFTGKPCKRGHIAKRYAATCSCVECTKGHFNDWRSKNEEIDRARSRAWQIANPDKTAANIARYENGRDLRTPRWADHSKINAIYEQAKLLTLTTGIPHHVDHIIPLHGKLVSGLHVHENLRAIPALENKKKSNLFVVI